jgi:3-hydroxybutyryl-CoA dehydrogenase
VKHVVVIGAGTMGSGIAHVAATAGIQTTLQDLSSEALAKAKALIEANLDQGVELGKVTPQTRDTALRSITFETDLKIAVGSAGFIIEAISENLDLKKELFSKLSKHAPKQAVLASNTSSLSITQMAEASGRPEQVIGMHFFNPVHKMKLIEVVLAKKTSEATLKATIELAQKMGKETVQVKESPGFVTSRMNALIGNEAFRMLEEGVASAQDIDKALKLGLNHPMGPFEMVDLVGLDVRLAILKYLQKMLGDLYKPNALLEKYVAEGRLGRKSGRGVYIYSK